MTSNATNKVEDIRLLCGSREMWPRLSSTPVCKDLCSAPDVLCYPEKFCDASHAESAYWILGGPLLSNRNCS